MTRATRGTHMPSLLLGGHLRLVMNILVSKGHSCSSPCNASIVLYSHLHVMAFVHQPYIVWASLALTILALPCFTLGDDSRKDVQTESLITLRIDVEPAMSMPDEGTLTSPRSDSDVRQKARRRSGLVSSTSSSRRQSRRYSVESSSGHAAKVWACIQGVCLPMQRASSNPT